VGEQGEGFERDDGSSTEDLSATSLLYHLFGGGRVAIVHAEHYQSSSI
jgi:hypothetical protein